MNTIGLGTSGEVPWNPYGQGTPTSSSPVPNPAYQGASQAVTGMSLPSLTNYINSMNQIGQSAANAGRVPQGASLEKQSSTNIGSELKGQVPSDVLRQMQQQAAERGVATGTAGSANNNAAYLQALGLTSLNLQGQGQKDLSAADARNPGAPLFDPASQLLTPYQANTLGQSAARNAPGPPGVSVALPPGGGGTPTTTSGDPFNDVATSANPGPTTASPWGDPTQQDWYNSIGAYPGQPGTPASVGTASTDSTQPVANWASLFDPSLGIDQSLYGGGQPQTSG